MWQLFLLEADWGINNQGIKSRTVRLLSPFPLWPITSAQFKHLQCHISLLWLSLPPSLSPSYSHTECVRQLLKALKSKKKVKGASHEYFISIRIDTLITKIRRGISKEMFSPSQCLCVGGWQGWNPNRTFYCEYWDYEGCGGGGGVTHLCWVNVLIARTDLRLINYAPVLCSRQRI